MNTDLLAFFVRISEVGAVAKAGREFGYSPASASAKLSALENYYRTPLVNRTTRSLSLTEEGTILYERAKNLVAELSDLTTVMHNGADKISGTIKITSTHDFGRNVLAAIFDSFMEINPEVSIHLLMEDGFKDLIGEGIDLAIRMGELKDSTLLTRKLGENYRVVCAAPGYIEAFGEPKHPEELLDHNCLGIMFSTGVDYEWPFSIGRKQKSIKVFGNRLANNGELVRQWCLAGYGIAYKSIWDVRADLVAGRLVELLPDFRVTPNSSLQVVYPGGRRPPRRVVALIDFLSEKLSELEKE